VTSIFSSHVGFQNDAPSFNGIDAGGSFRLPVNRDGSFANQPQHQCQQNIYAEQYRAGGGITAANEIDAVGGSIVAGGDIHFYHGLLPYSTTMITWTPGAKTSLPVEIFSPVAAFSLQSTPALRQQGNILRQALLPAHSPPGGGPSRSRATAQAYSARVLADTISAGGAAFINA